MSLKKQTSPNPQGKGKSETLGLLTRSGGESDLPHINNDGLQRIITDYLRSFFVLSCEFKFKPVPGKSYYIYSHKNSMILSLIRPDEGGERIFDAAVGTCRLNRDLSWTVRSIADGELTVGLDGESNGSDLEVMRAILRSIGEIDRWKFDAQRGYYQNVMSYMFLRTLHYRCERLKNSGLVFTENERRLLDEL